MASFLLRLDIMSILRDCLLLISNAKNAKWIVGPLVFVSSAILLKWIKALPKRWQLASKVRQKQQERELALKRLRGELLVNGELMTSKRQEIINMSFEDLRLELANCNYTATEVLLAFQAKAILVHDKTNCVTGFIEDALERARQLDLLPKGQRKPLHGLPISCKELLNFADQEATVGIPSNLGIISKEDAGIVLALKQLGAVPFVRTNMSQTCVSFECSNPIFGSTVNPRNVNRGPGGSSGGEGAIIAGGGSIMGFGTDLGGSVRIPAHYSGITALKPTAGRVPLTGQGSDGGLNGVIGIHNSVGFMARSAKDIQVCFKEIVNLTSLSPLTADPRLVHIPWRDHVAQVGQTRLRIGWHDFDGVVEATPGVKRAVHVAIAALEALGHEVIPYCLPHMDKINALHGPLMTADGWKTTKDLLQHCQRDDLSLGPVLRAWLVPDCLTRIIAPIVRVLYSPVLATFLTNPSKCSQSWQLWEKYNERLDLVKDILADWEINDVDVIIAPGMAMPSLKLGYSAYSFPAKSYTHNYNVLNFPAGSVPVSMETADDQKQLEDNYPLMINNDKCSMNDPVIMKWVKEGSKGAEGMPLNVQIIGKPWCEEMVLRVMQELEESVGNPGFPVHL